MSWYNNIIKRDDKNYIVAYGFDRILQSYYLQVFDPSKPDEPIVNFDTDPLAGDPISTRDLINEYVKWQVPKHHVIKLVLDLPF